MGATAPGNVSGARNSSISWRDVTGNLWLFGGYVNNFIGANGGATGYFNDLWKY
jgi:hypothetical protein